MTNAKDLIGGKVTYKSEREVGWLPAREIIRWNVTLVKSESSVIKNETGRGVLINGRVMDSNSNVLRRTEGKGTSHALFNELTL